MFWSAQNVFMVKQSFGYMLFVTSQGGVGKRPHDYESIYSPCTCRPLLAIAVSKVDCRSIFDLSLVPSCGKGYSMQETYKK